MDLRMQSCGVFFAKHILVNLLLPLYALGPIRLPARRQIAATLACLQGGRSFAATLAARLLFSRQYCSMFCQTAVVHFAVKV